MWHLGGRRHSQDEALVREVSRWYAGEPTFGIGCYEMIPGEQFPLDSLVEDVLRYRDSLPRSLLEEDEHYLNNLNFP